MLPAIVVAASFLTLPVRGAVLVESTTKALETGFIQGHYDEIKTIIVAPQRFLPAVRKLESHPKFDLEFVVELRAECNDPELRDWCRAKLLEGSPAERAAAMRGLYRIGTNEDVPELLAGLGQQETERWAALALGRLQVKEAIPLLLARLGRSGSSGGASAAPGALTLGLKEACRFALQDYGPAIIPSVLPIIQPGSDASATGAACQIVRRFWASEACDRVFSLARVRLAQLRASKKPSFEQYMEMRELIFTLQQFSDARSEPFERALAKTPYATNRGLDFEPSPLSTLATLLHGGPSYGIGVDIVKVLDHEPKLAASFVIENFEKIDRDLIPELLERLVRSRLDKQDQLRILVLASESKVAKIRRYAAYGFGFLLKPESRPYLLQLMLDSDPNVRRQATETASIVIGVPMALNR